MYEKLCQPLGYIGTSGRISLTNVTLSDGSTQPLNAKAEQALITR